MSAITAKARRKMKKYAVLTREPRCFLGSFDFSWEQRKLGDVVQITMGQSPDGSTYSDEPSDYILVQGNADLQNGWVCPRIWTTQITKKADAGDLIMSVRAPAGAMGKTAYNAVIGRGVAAIKGNEFIYQLLVKMDADGFWKTLSCGSTFESLNSDNIKNAEVKIPTTAEQIKIGGYFQQLDNLITLHQRKCANLCSPSQVVFSLLFATSTFSWEQRKFGEITSKYENPVPTPHDGYYRLGIRSHAKGTFHSYVAKGQELETAQMHRVAAGNFIVNITFGWEHAVAITDKNDAGKLVSHRFPQFSFAEGMVPEFFRYVIVDEKFRHHLWLASPGGAGRNRVLKLDEMLNYLMRFPSRDEQIKIAEFFRHLDNLITLHQRQSFSHSTPDISLSVQLIHPFYTSSWEQRKFEEIAVRSSVICSDDTLPRVEYEDIVSGTGRLNKDIYAKQSIKSGIAFHQGDVLYGKLRPYLQNWLLPTFDGLAVGDFWVLQPQNADSSFLYRLIQSRQFDEVANQSTGTKMPRADWKLVSKTVFSIPSNISEQAAIGTYFTALDSLITLHQRKGKAAVSGCSNDANNSKGVCCKARDFGYKCHKKRRIQIDSMLNCSVHLLRIG